MKKVQVLTPEQKARKVAYDVRWRKSNLDKCCAYSAKWRKLHRAQYLEGMRRHGKTPAGKAAQKKWRASHKADCARRMTEWRRNNPDKWRALIRKSKRKRYWRSLHHRVKELVSAGIYKAAKKDGAIKSARTIELLGTSVSGLREWLQAQFLPGMSWDNMGRFGWHIDHRIPCAAFDLSDPLEQKLCFHYTNLQPLWWRDNLSKGAKL